MTGFVRRGTYPLPTKDFPHSGSLNETRFSTERQIDSVLNLYRTCHGRNRLPYLTTHGRLLYFSLYTNLYLQGERED